MNRIVPIFWIAVRQYSPNSSRERSVARPSIPTAFGLVNSAVSANQLSTASTFFPLKFRIHSSANFRASFSVIASSPNVPKILNPNCSSRKKILLPNSARAYPVLLPAHPALIPLALRHSRRHTETPFSFSTATVLSSRHLRATRFSGLDHMSTKTKLLIAEHTLAISNNFTARLLELGYAVSATAASAQQAITLAESLSPDLVLLDIHLPGETTAIAAASDIRRRFHIPVVFIAATAEEITLEQGKPAQPYGYVLHSADDRDLRTNIEVALFCDKSQAALIERERRLQTILQTSLDAFWIVDPAGYFLEVNDAFCEMSGFPRDELLLLNISHIKGNPYEDDPLALVLKNTHPGASRIESRLCRKDGAIIDIEASVNFHDFDSGRFVFFLRDVTARNRAELQLRQSEERFSKAFRGSPLSISISSLADGRVLDVNDAFLQMFHLQRKDVIGFTHSQTALWVETSQRITMFKKVQDSGRATAFRAQLKTSRNEIFDAEISCELIDVGGIRCVLAVVVDVTEAQRMEARLRQAHKMEAVGNLAGGVAHDFNNLLAVIMGYCDISVSLVGPQTALSANLAEIRNAAQQATVLTHQLLAFGRRQIVFPKILDLNEVVQHALTLLNRSLPHNVHILLRPARSLGSIKVDPIQLEQVLTSLVENARDAMPQGGRISLETSSVDLDEHTAAGFPDCQPGSFVVLTVGDTGCGMDDSTLSRIFEPFFTTKEGGHGSGLGLSTVYGIVQQSRGHIQVRSEPGKGTTFTVYFPKVVEPGRRIQSRVADSPAAQGSATILLVESDKPLRQLAGTLLHAAGYRVIEAEDAQAAIDILHSSTPIDLLFTDVLMSCKSGPELAAEAKLLRPTLPFLFMSGYSGSLITAGFDRIPESNFLQKPFTRQDLLARIQSILQPAHQDQK